MNFRDLKYFTTLAEVNNFKTAAELCFVTQPTLSMQIKKLEEELNIMLFERDKRFVKITPEGKQLLQYTEQILQLKADMKRAASNLQDPNSGTIDLGIFPTLSPYLLPKVITKIGKALPKLEINLHEISSEKCINQVSNGKLDVILIAEPLSNDKLAHMPLFNENFFLVCSKEHPLNQYSSIPDTKIPENELLLLSEGHCLRDQSIQYCQRIGKQHDTSFSATSLSTIIAMVALGKGISLVPSLAQRQTQHQAVNLLNFKSKPPSRTVAMYWRKSLKRDEIFKQLGQIIQRCLKSTEGVTIVE